MTIRCKLIGSLVISAMLIAAPSGADVTVGTKAYMGKQYDVAFAEFNKSAAQGDILATRYLAIMYFLGQGTTKDERRGMDLSRQCGQAGDSSCMIQAAESLLMGRGTAIDLVEARDWARKALHKGDVRGGFFLGQAYLLDPNNRYLVDGKADMAKYQTLAHRDVSQRGDQIEAFEALAVSAQAGFVPAQLLLATELYTKSGGTSAEKIVTVLSAVKELPEKLQPILAHSRQVLALGGTHASPRLVNDALTTAIIGATSQARRSGVKDVKGCNDFKLTKISNVTPIQDVEWLPLKPLLVANTYPLKGSWTEDWTVTLCQKPYTVHLEFQADGLGGAYHTTRN